jgi:hypothetical protein
LNNNLINRYPMPGQIALLCQEILRKQWQLNGETIIIGKTGLVLDGQHTLIALVFANQKWTDKQGQYQAIWPTAPTISKVVVYGIEETDAVVNTINTGRPRTLTDVIYRSEYFQGVKVNARRKLAKMTDHAVRQLWDRTGAGMDAFTARKTHAEALDFIARHPRVFEAIKHIYEENGTDGRLKPYLGPGYSSALMYLMAGCTTDRDKDDGTGYTNVPAPSENQIDFEHWDKASEFWVKLAAGDKGMAPIKAAIADIGDGITLDERMAIVVKGWNAWVEHGKITAKDLQLVYATNEAGNDVLSEIPIVGGIDLGKTKAA